MRHYSDILFNNSILISCVLNHNAKFNILNAKFNVLNDGLLYNLLVYKIYVIKIYHFIFNSPFFIFHLKKFFPVSFTASKLFSNYRSFSMFVKMCKNRLFVKKVVQFPDFYISGLTDRVVCV